MVWKGLGNYMQKDMHIHVDMIIIENRYQNTFLLKSITSHLGDRGTVYTSQQYTHVSEPVSSPQTPLHPSFYLYKPIPDPLPPPPRHRYLVLLLQPIHLIHAAENVDLAGLTYPWCAEPDLVTKIQHQENGQGDVRGEEGGSGEGAWEENLKAVC